MVGQNPKTTLQEVINGYCLKREPRKKTRGERSERVEGVK
jgi:hypothetical protein